MRIVTVVGNRPQFVKAAAVSRLLREHHEELIVHTGQHYDDALSRVFFDELGIPAPDRQLEAGTGTNTAQTARILGELERVLDALEPDLVLVYGDTNSTLAEALDATQSRRAVGPVEAGMCSFDRAMPEELNRVLCDHASDLLLCSTPRAVENLAAEGLREGVHLVGDVMADVSMSFAEVAEQRSRALEEHGLTAAEYLLVTAHRAGNVDPPERLEALVELLESLPLPAVFPLHPRTHARLTATGLLGRLERAERLTLVPPLGYLDFLVLARSARAVLTDSGGVQKEAYLLGVPCVTLRPSTEWVETVDAGWNALVDLDREAALAALAHVERGEVAAHPRPELYGAGRAAERIVEVIGTYTSAP
ncbi:MAG: non-hydrolyzing UDP-N-acetylglucosamine 2-epimerase [Thermoleophilaceae bacterium]